ncbi:hypothetical protein [Mycolicibacterium brisbanense]
MTRGKADPLAELRRRYEAVCGQLELVRGERDEARAQLTALRREHTNACGYWVRHNEAQQARIAELEAALAAAERGAA